jgi:hypothetical protein
VDEEDYLNFRKTQKESLVSQIDIFSQISDISEESLEVVLTRTGILEFDLQQFMLLLKMGKTAKEDLL